MSAAANSRVNTFSFGGLHTVIDTWEYRQLDEHDYDFPYQDFLQTEPDPEIISFALDVLRAFEISVGPAHIEVKAGSGGPVLIEIVDVSRSRYPGAAVVVLADSRPYRDTLAAHLGKQPMVMRRPPAFGACVGMTFIRNDGPPGVLRGLDGLAEVGRLRGVDAVHVRAGIGDQVPTSDHLGSELVAVFEPQRAVPPGVAAARHPGTAAHLGMDRARRESRPGTRRGDGLRCAPRRRPSRCAVAGSPGSAMSGT